MIHFPERIQLENLWRNRLRETRQQLDSARILTNALLRVTKDVESPEGKLAYQQALNVESMALAEYRRALHIFAELVLDGKVPDEEEWRKASGA